MEAKLVLALGGGGVRSAAHLGVMHALDSAGIKISGIAGTSSGVNSVFIEPGKPWRTSPAGAVLSKTQNGYVEGFNSRFRVEFLRQHFFHSLAEAKTLCESFRRYFNDGRLHSSLGYCPPSEFRAGLNHGTKVALALID